MIRFSQVVFAALAFRGEAISLHGGGGGYLAGGGAIEAIEGWHEEASLARQPDVTSLVQAKRLAADEDDDGFDNQNEHSCGRSVCIVIRLLLAVGFLFACGFFEWWFRPMFSEIDRPKDRWFTYLVIVSSVLLNVVHRVWAVGSLKTAFDRTQLCASMMIFCPVNAMSVDLFMKLLQLKCEVDEFPALHFASSLWLAFDLLRMSSSILGRFCCSCCVGRSERSGLREWTNMFSRKNILGYIISILFFAQSCGVVLSQEKEKGVKKYDGGQICCGSWAMLATLFWYILALCWPCNSSTTKTKERNQEIEDGKGTLQKMVERTRGTVDLAGEKLLAVKDRAHDVGQVFVNAAGTAQQQASKVGNAVTNGFVNAAGAAHQRAATVGHAVTEQLTTVAGTTTRGASALTTTITQLLPSSEDVVSSITHTTEGFKQRAQAVNGIAQSAAQHCADYCEAIIDTGNTGGTQAHPDVLEIVFNRSLLVKMNEPTTFGKGGFKCNISKGGRSVEITEVRKDSLADKLGFRGGYEFDKCNGQPVIWKEQVFDFGFECIQP